MSDPKRLFEMMTADGAVQVTQADPERVTFAIGVVGDVNVVHLRVEEALALCTAILRENLGLLMHVAEHELDDETCAAVGQAYLFGPAKRALDRMPRRGGGGTGGSIPEAT